ncbi:mandelate racemase/muconate lactonizing enzyme family protein [Fodinicurvata sp. EGI_FJ10296]|uniref:mandelate racemase/muconate lactonizing enzyme family protein n=1 Tax=Fodinicurvata sp. EGI_FJ10296 TaxID=3231908 RepID=UPI0034568DFD
MKVVKVTGHRVDPGWRKNWIFVQVETDDGITGWGECYSQSDRDLAVLAQVTELGRYLTDRDPQLIRHFRHIVFNDYVGRRGSMEVFSALSGIEAALWDIVGKACGQPVHALLGGRVRESVRVYANGWSHGMKDPKGIAEAASAVVEGGYTALKLDPLPGPVRSFIDRNEINAACRVVEAVRDAVGPDVDLLVDAHRRLSASNAMALERRFRDYDLFWYEEPCPCENVAALREVRDRSETPIVTGEAAYTKFGFAEIIRNRAVDILNPDVAACGGILELLEIAAMAAAEHIALSPHNYNSTTLALSATVHASLCAENFLITEYFMPFEEVGLTVAPDALTPVGGYIKAPDAPGLGLTIDQAVIAERPGRVYPARGLPNVGTEGP